MIGPLIAGTLSALLGRQVAQAVSQSLSQRLANLVLPPQAQTWAKARARRAVVRLTRNTTGQQRRAAQPNAKPQPRSRNPFRQFRVPAPARNALRNLRQRLANVQKGLHPSGSPLPPSGINPATGGTFAPLTTFQKVVAGITGRMPAPTPGMQGPPQRPTPTGALPARVAGMAGQAIAAHPYIAAGLAATAALVGLARSGNRLAESQLEHQQRLRQFNAQIARAYATLERGDVLRSRASAGNTATTTAMMVSAINDLRDTVRPLQDIGTNILNVLGTIAVRSTESAFGMAKMIPILGNLLWLAEMWEGKGKDKQGVWEGLFAEGHRQNQERHKPKDRKPPKP